MLKSWLKAISPFIWTENPSEGGRERENEREREEWGGENERGKKEIVTLRGRERERLLNVLTDTEINI